MNLVILAAGMGSRFGGLKQIETVDDEGNFIIDYSIFDAIIAGFDKVIIIIKKENLKYFTNRFGKQRERKVKIKFAFQELNSFVPSNLFLGQRKKPFGTAHALLCAKDFVDDDFAVINADDFYGRNSFKIIYDFLSKNKKDSAMAGFKVINTLTDFGSVKRGICRQREGVFNISESEIWRKDNKIFARKINEKETFEISPNTLVSMNLFGLRRNFFDFLQKEFEEFLEKNKSDLSNCEFFLPEVVSKYIKIKREKLEVLKTDEKWYGLTYKKDFDVVSKGILKLKEKGVYPRFLRK